MYWVSRVALPHPPVARPLGLALIGLYFTVWGRLIPTSLPRARALTGLPVYRWLLRRV